LHLNRQSEIDSLVIQRRRDRLCDAVGFTELLG
jgi:hypothetical protein